MQYSTPYPLNRRLVAMGALLVFAVMGAVLSEGAMSERHGDLKVVESNEADRDGQGVIGYDALMAALERTGRVEAVGSDNGFGAGGIHELASPPTKTTVYADR
jgi:hypothetical protein